VDRFDEAIKIFKELIEINPRSAMQRYNLGLVYARMNEFTTALEYYVDALSMFKRSNQIIKSIVDAHHELGNNNLAKAYLNVILRRDPDDSFAKEKLAQLSQKS
jgi:tetratricopeptide (TPR) repeat protein